MTRVRQREHTALKLSEPFALYTASDQSEPCQAKTAYALSPEWRKHREQCERVSWWDTPPKQSELYIEHTACEPNEPFQVSTAHHASAPS